MTNVFQYPQLSFLYGAGPQFFLHEAIAPALQAKFFLNIAGADRLFTQGVWQNASGVEQTFSVWPTTQGVLNGFPSSRAEAPRSGGVRARARAAEDHPPRAASDRRESRGPDVFLKSRVFRQEGEAQSAGHERPRDAIAGRASAKTLLSNGLKSGKDLRDAQRAPAQRSAYARAQETANGAAGELRSDAEPTPQTAPFQIFSPPPQPHDEPARETAHAPTDREAAVIDLALARRFFQKKQEAGALRSPQRAAMARLEASGADAKDLAKFAGLSLSHFFYNLFRFARNGDRKTPYWMIGDRLFPLGGYVSARAFSRASYRD